MDHMGRKIEFENGSANMDVYYRLDAPGVNVMLRDENDPDIWTYRLNSSQVSELMDALQHQAECLAAAQTPKLLPDV